MGNARLIVRWTDNEWFLVARYLYQNEIITLSDDIEAFDHVQTEHIRKAAKETLEVHRRRADANLNMPQVRVMLHKKVSEFKSQLAGCSLHHQPEPIPAVTSEVVTVGQAENTLMTMFASKIIEGISEPIVAQLKVFVAETMVKYGMVRSDVTVAEILQEKPIEKPVHRYKVGLVGLLPIQAESFKSQFREIDFTYADGDDKKRRQIVSMMENKDLVLSLTSKMNHGLDDALRDAFVKQDRKDSYKRCHGGPTEMARALRVWLVSKQETNQ